MTSEKHRPAREKEGTRSPEPWAGKHLASDGRDHWPVWVSKFRVNEKAGPLRLPWLQAQLL